MATVDYSALAQKNRCDQITSMVTDYHIRHFNDCGVWDDPNLFIPIRERMYFSLTFLRSGRPDAIRKANGIIRTANYMRCTFSPMIALQILTKYESLLDEDCVSILNEYVKGDLEEACSCDFDYVGVNDNFPSMATCETILAGERYNLPEVLACGKKKLRQFAALFTRRGAATEYNSPTYSPIQILAMAEIVNLCKDPEAKELARQCEERIWADCLGHLHPETCQSAGPYSRAYGGDSAGYTGLMRCAFYALLGDALPINICNTLLESEQGEKDGYVHNGAVFTQLNAVWFGDTTYHCPDYLAHLALNKQYPYEILSTSEFSPSSDMPPVTPAAWPEGEMYNYEYPAGVSRLVTYMEADYALGTASHEFHNGVQTDSFHLLYRRRTPALRQRDINTVYARYIVNDQQPTYGMVWLQDAGRKLGIQQKNTAMMLYKPKPYFQKGVSSLKLSLIIPVHTGMVEELWLGDCKMIGDSISSKEPCSVYIKDGPVYMAYHPLLLTDHGRQAAVTAERMNEYLVVSFWNYSGEAKDFGMREMLLIGNGFVAEIRSESECESFESFRRTFADYTVEEKLQANVHSRFAAMRKTKYTRDGLTIECEYSPVTEGIKQISLNGHTPKQPKLSISGFDCTRLPFMEE